MSREISGTLEDTQRVRSTKGGVGVADMFDVLK